MAPRILVVDDEMLILHVFQRWFMRNGFNVEVATSVAEACEIVERGRIDAVVTDYELHGLSGGHLVDWLRLRWPSIPVVVMSGYPDPVLGASCPDACLQKPIRYAELAQLLEVLHSRGGSAFTIGSA